MSSHRHVTRSGKASSPVALRYWTLSQETTVVVKERQIVSRLVAPPAWKSVVFPLTLSLSLREREQPPDFVSCSCGRLPIPRSDRRRRRGTILPLPKGESRGGKRDACIAQRPMRGRGARRSPEGPHGFGPFINSSLRLCLR